ncbi:MAG: ribulose-phosphate 3-epimerase [Bacteroidetes bacterium]|nr:ribulose-phosphate 3-epimerase [Bacteroidota bacterium]
MKNNSSPIKRKIQIAPSMLSSDFSTLRTEINKCNEAGVDVIHLDIMDGHFVPNITFGPIVVEAIRPYTNLPLDCHLMIENADKYIPFFAKAGADMISVHVEGAVHLHRTISLIKENNIKVGVALNPVTPLEYAFEVAEFVDFILLMSVNPGFGGQSFINTFIERCIRLRSFLDERESTCNVDIEVDGGIKTDNLEKVIGAGANIIVSGSGLFSGNFHSNVEYFKKIISNRQ